MRKFIEQPIIVTGESKAKVDLVLIQSFLLYYVFDFVFMLSRIFFKHNFHKKRKEVCIKTRSTLTSLTFNQRLGYLF